MFMVSALKGDNVIEIKKKKFNNLEKKLILILRIILFLLFAIYLADSIFS
jgi:hypothetical protein